LWVLLALDAIAAQLWAVSPRGINALGQLIHALRDRPTTTLPSPHQILDRVRRRALDEMDARRAIAKASPHSVDDLVGVIVDWAAVIA
jgi:hypothetical protein